MDFTKDKLNLKNTYSDLPDCFFKKTKPTKVENPHLIYFNNKLATYLNLNIFENDLISNYFSGNKLLENSNPIAQAYAGHQFGNFTMLGDGRAILLGEYKDKINKLYDIQLKGSGKTPFSRRGDGRATLSSMLREYLISESMYYLKIPTTRSLAVVSTGEKVYRDSINEGAILTRIASSHIRFGTFEFGKNFCSNKDFKVFVDYVIKRHYPEILKSKSPYLELLKLIINKYIDLIINWIRVGFIHGVMNTDNMTISGETIDYGPCAFMNSYDPETVFSSIDKQGRYAFGNQHKIAYWNITVFAGTILHLIEKDKSKAIELVQNCLNKFPSLFSNQWIKMMCKKIGIINPTEKDKLLVSDLIRLMENHNADYTNTFASLTLNKYHNNSLFISKDFKIWEKKWNERIKNKEKSFKIMQKNNPLYIPRNHLVELALKNASSGDKQSFDNLLELMSKTYNYDSKNIELQIVPKDFDKTYKTFCGT